jgi:antitoxin component of MazEF toxin-antitoxin module
MTDSAKFDTTVTATGNNTGIVVPDDIMEQLGAGKRPAVVVSVNGYEYRSTVGVMGGKHMISISAALRKETGLKGGDAIHVELTVADTPRRVEVDDDFAAALSAEPSTKGFFETLSNSLQRFHVGNINGAKTAETRQRRIEKAISQFREGKQR